MQSKTGRLAWRVPAITVLLAGLISLIAIGHNTVSLIDAAPAATPTRRVNVPYLGGGPPAEYFEPAIFWFGQVTPKINNADVRMWYYDSYMKVTIHIIDRLLWYDQNPSEADLTNWDAVSLYLDKDGNVGNVPGSDSFRFVAQLNWYEPRENWQAGARGNGATWVSDPVSFSTESGYRGAHNDNANDKGWQIEYFIPFTSLGLSGPPSTGTTWGLAVEVHDRDDAGGSAIPGQIWPEQMDSDKPATWGQLHFGRSQYGLPPAIPEGSSTIRHGLNGASVADGHVGGHTTCGEGLDHWSEWGTANYAGYGQINIQNQWDISDYPCFSKYFVTFPLVDVPSGKIIIAATLKMRLFGGSANPGGETPDSYIQVLTMGEDWDESTLSWNNAPLAVENFNGTWVKPTWLSPELDYDWDVTKAVAEAYQSGEPLRLAMYSADGERHTGKYFWSSDSGVQSTSQRPTLTVVWGNKCDSPGIVCWFTYLPLAIR